MQIMRNFSYAAYTKKREEEEEEADFT